SRRTRSCHRPCAASHRRRGWFCGSGQAAPPEGRQRRHSLSRGRDLTATCDSRNDEQSASDRPAPSPEDVFDLDRRNYSGRRKQDSESIRLLVGAGANLSATENNGLVAEQLTSDKVVKRALDPEKERSGISKLAAIVVSVLSYIVSWVNKTANGVMKRLFGLDPVQNDNMDQVSTSVVGGAHCSCGAAGHQRWRDPQQGPVSRKHRHLRPREPRARTIL
ncbi:unnamed protein product, partial [Mycena citricolor]